MKEQMKVLIAYDGSDCADAAIDDLRRAGLPPEGELLVVAVADIYKTAVPVPSEILALKKLVSERILAKTVMFTKNEKMRLRQKARALAMKGSFRLRTFLPGWKIYVRAVVGKPADELLHITDEWKPDLIVAGSNGRSAIGRFFLGSVSKTLAEESNFPVRVARRNLENNSETPAKIIIGASNLAEAEKIIKSVGRRFWTSKTQARLIAADDGVSNGRVSAVYPYAEAIFEQTADELRYAGLEVSVKVRSGDLKSVLLKEIDDWEAGSVFIPARGSDDKFDSNDESGLSDESGLNETALSLITDAACTIEIVR